MLAYIVMPPAHGKSYNAGKIPRLYESDGIVDPKGTLRLRMLRAGAKRTGNWASYDKHWGRLIKEDLADIEGVVMVQSRDIGEAMGATFLGAYYLPERVWEENLKMRVGSVEKYRDCWEAVKRYGIQVDSNEDMTKMIEKCVADWNNYLCNLNDPLCQHFYDDCDNI